MPQHLANLPKTKVVEMCVVPLHSKAAAAINTARVLIEYVRS
jgi:hypothetical protein